MEDRYGASRCEAEEDRLARWGTGNGCRIDPYNRGLEGFRREPFLPRLLVCGRPDLHALRQSLGLLVGLPFLRKSARRLELLRTERL